MPEDLVPVDEKPDTFEDKNGAIHDAKTGKIIKAAPGMPFDSKRGREMALRRAEKLRQKTRQGVEEGVQRAMTKRNGNVPAESFKFPEAHQEVISSIMDEVVMNPREKGKGRIDAYRTVLEIEGSLGNIKKPDMEGTPAIQISLNDRASAALFAAFFASKARREAPDTIEGSFKVDGDD